MDDKFSKPALIADLKKEISKNGWDGVLLDNDLLWRALDLAWDAHAGQCRENSEHGSNDVPYITHPVGVAKFAISLWEIGELEDDLASVVIVSLLHDVLEDSFVEFATIEELFGRRIAALCEALTKPPRQNGQTRADRNERAAEKILAAGPTAIYVKACDALHNISRPSTMPITLLEKTIEKISGPYLRLVTGQSFESRFVPLFSNALEKGRLIVGQSGNSSRDFDGHSFEDVLEFISTRTASKVFEEHDIVAFFLSLPGIVSCYIGLADQVEANFQSAGDGLTKNDRRQLLTRNELELPTSNNELDQAARRLISVPLFNSLLVNDDRRLFLELDCRSAAAWVRPKLVTVVMALLTERRVAQMRDRSLEIASLISFHSLDLDVREAIKLSLQVQDILTLVECVRFSANAVDHLLLELKSEGLSSSADSIIERMEWRTKDLGVALRKAHARSIEFGDLDDLIGFRFVSLSVKRRELLAQRISKFLVDQMKHNSSLVFSSKNDFEPVKVQSSGGYSAVHISFEITSLDDSSIKVGCEFQIRTIAEDAVARIMHEITYKSSKLSKSQRKKLEKSLSEIRGEIDNLVQVGEQS